MLVTLMYQTGDTFSSDLVYELSLLTQGQWEDGGLTAAVAPVITIISITMLLVLTKFSRYQEDQLYNNSMVMIMIRVGHMGSGVT